MTKSNSLLKVIKFEAFIVGAFVILSGLINTILLMLNNRINVASAAAILFVIGSGIALICEAQSLSKEPLKHTGNIIAFSIIFIVATAAFKIGSGLLYILLFGLILSAFSVKRRLKKESLTFVENSKN